MKYDTYIGIDAGAKGGVAYLRGTPHACYVEAFPMPHELKNLADILRHAAAGFTLVCTEKLHSRPGQSSQSTFSFGERYGEIHGICATLGLELLEVDPKAWQALVLGSRSSLPTGYDLGRWTKAASIAHCREVYPHVSLTPPGHRVASDGMADALCIAEYAYRRSNPLT